MARGPCTVASFLPESPQVGGGRGFQAIGRQTMGVDSGDEDASMVMVMVGIQRYTKAKGGFGQLVDKQWAWIVGDDLDRRRFTKPNVHIILLTTDIKD